MDNPEKLGTQDEEKQNTTQHNTICIGHHNMQTIPCFCRWLILHFIAI